MAKSFKEYIGTSGLRIGNIDNVRPMVSLGKTDTPPKRNGRTADARAVGLNANYSSQAPGTMRPFLKADAQKLQQKNWKEKGHGPYRKEEIEEGVGLEMIKALIPKKILHAFKRAIHAKNYKVALNIYHDLTREIRKDPEKFKRKLGQRDGVVIGNVDNIAKSIAADMAGIKYREFLKILDRKTRYAEYVPEDLYSDDNPNDTVKGTGYGDAEAARKTLQIIKSVDKERQMQIVNTMYNRAKHHANRTSDMEDAMKIFKSWIDKNKLKETPLYNYMLEKGVIKEI